MITHDRIGSLICDEEKFRKSKAVWFAVCGFSLFPCPGMNDESRPDDPDPRLYVYVVRPGHLTSFQDVVE